MSALGALRACRAYVKAEDNIRELTTAIGVHLSGCELANKRPGGEPLDFQDLSKRIKDGSTHLSVAYRNNATALAVGYTGEVKGWAEMLACPHCKAAHEAVQARKEARQKLGAAKRMIRAAAQDGGEV